MSDLLQTLWAQLAAYEDIWVWVGLGSAILFFGTLLALPWLAALIPVDYFTHTREPIAKSLRLHPVLRIVVHIVRNTLGLLLIAAGILMLFLPGQGLLTILLGVLVMHFPGKYRLEQWLVQQPGILPALNWLRAKRSVPALTPPQR
jgi:archaellum biogenesis protein FlaJ (TadC family)